MAEKKKQKRNTESVLIRVELPVWEKVKDFVKQSKQSIGGFYTLAAEEKLQKDKNR